MTYFTRELARLNPDPSHRRWIFAPYDQLSDKIGPLCREEPKNLGVILIENSWKAARRPYHKQKLALIMANMRCFSLEQARRGVAVRHVVTSGPYSIALEALAKELGTIRMMAPAERELRKDLEPLVKAGSLESISHEGWLTRKSQFDAIARKGPHWRMDDFYRCVRKDSGILMEKNKPIGGRFSFDSANRKPWRGKPPAPIPPTFPSNPIKEEVGDLIEEKFSHHPGHLNLSLLPSTSQDAQALWSWAKDECIQSFGPYEDAISVLSTGIFHTRISSLLNIHRLLPNQIISDVLDMDEPLHSKEGFIRQVLGWREFVRHVHVATDGFRLEIGTDPNEQITPGDGGYERWAGKPWPRKMTDRDPSGGAAPSKLGCDNHIPPAFWGIDSGLKCLDHVVASTWSEGYSHHITRLMILSNIASLLDISPRDLADWFWIAYTDAYDWVVEPNVLGMGAYAVGNLMTTKPYISGAAYISRMSDFCPHCGFDPKTNCPITHLYWAYLERHRSELEKVPRMALPLKSLIRRAKSQKIRDREVFEIILEKLALGERLCPT